MATALIGAAEYVENKIQYIWKMRNTGIGKARLADLRRGAGKVPGELPELWGIFLEQMPEAWMRTDGRPGREEWAVYIALTMFALHQQGHENLMHQRGDGLGKSIRRLVNPAEEGDEDRVLRRFKPLVTATDMREASYHLRAIIQLLRAKEIPLDYGRLTTDLVFFQIPDRRAQVQLRWGQDFYRYVKEKEGEEI